MSAPLGHTTVPPSRKKRSKYPGSFSGSKTGPANQSEKSTVLSTPSLNTSRILGYLLADLAILRGFFRSEAAIAGDPRDHAFSGCGRLEAWSKAAGVSGADLPGPGPGFRVSGEEPVRRGTSAFLDSHASMGHDFSMITTVTRKNMVTIPAEVGRKLGIKPGWKLDWQPVEGREEILVRVIPDRGELARRLLGAGRKFSPNRDAVAELVAERSAEG